LTRVKHYARPNQYREEAAYLPLLLAGLVLGASFLFGDGIRASNGQAQGGLALPSDLPAIEAVELFRMGRYLNVGQIRTFRGPQYRR
jgi:hypothetical protein